MGCRGAGVLLARSPEGERELRAGGCCRQRRHLSSACRRISRISSPYYIPLCVQAIAAGHAAAVAALVAGGLDPNSRLPDSGLSLLEAAAHHGRGEVITALIRGGQGQCRAGGLFSEVWLSTCRMGSALTN